MTDYFAPHKTLFFVCCSAVITIVANQASLLGNSDTHLAELSHQDFVEEFERYVASNEEHPWCGTGRLEETEVGYLVPYGDNGVRFINEEEYEKLIPARLAKE